MGCSLCSLQRWRSEKITRSIHSGAKKWFGMQSRRRIVNSAVSKMMEEREKREIFLKFRDSVVDDVVMRK